MSLKRPRSPSPLSLTEEASQWESSTLEPKHVQLGVQTVFPHLYYNLDAKHKPLYESTACYANVSVSLQQPQHDVAIPTPHYVYVIDTSGSMGNGRLHCAVHSLEASCHLLDASVQITVFTFSDHARLIYSGLNPRDTMDSIKRELHADGGTNIIEAVQKTIEYCTELQAKSSASVAVLFMTDGEDMELSKAVTHHKLGSSVPLFDEIVPQIQSGVFFNFVGISRDAAIQDLAYMAEKARGTFASVQQDDILNVMGMLVGLTQERIPNAMALNVKVVGINSEGQQPVGAAEFPVQNELIQVRKSAPTKISFEIPLFLVLEAVSYLEQNQQQEPDSVVDVMIVATVTIFPLGVNVFRSSNVKKVTESHQLKAAPAPCCLTPNVDPLLSFAEKAWGQLNHRVADMLRKKQYDVILHDIAGIQALLAKFKAACRDFDHFDGVVAGKLEEICASASQQEAEVQQCKSDVMRFRDLEMRALSFASTQRNASISLDPSRSMSVAQSHALDQIRTISMTLSSDDA